MVQTKDMVQKAKVGRKPNPVPTKAIRLPFPIVEKLLRFKEEHGFEALYRKDIGEVLRVNPSLPCSFPLFQSRIQAGFPSPSDDFKDGSLDLNQHLVPHKAATFFVRVTGESMTGVGIFPIDLLIVDRSLTPVSGNVIIAVLNGEMTVKRLEKRKVDLFLCAENKKYDEIQIREEDDFSVWGVVTNVIHSLL